LERDIELIEAIGSKEIVSAFRSKVFILADPLVLREVIGTFRKF
jgi:hypothetical protein